MKPTTKSADGTSFHDSTFTTSVSVLRSVLGEPYCENNDGSDKCNFDWIMETDNGDVFTVYDWKYYRTLEEDEPITWHIGGDSMRITEQARKELINEINKYNVSKPAFTINNNNN